MIYRYRCWRAIKAKGKKDSRGNRQCGGRKSLRKMLEFYVRRPVCPSCGQDTLTLDKYRMSREVGETGRVCRCDGLGYPHRLGSKWCNHYEGEYTEEDYYHYRPLGTT